jgi:hypothetical protein
MLISDLRRRAGIDANLTEEVAASLEWLMDFLR